MPEAWAPGTASGEPAERVSSAPDARLAGTKVGDPHAPRLVGGLYGVSLGGAFFGESMFARAPDASKLAFVALVALGASGRPDVGDEHDARVARALRRKHAR